MEEIFLQPETLVETAENSSAAEYGKSLRRWTRAFYLSAAAGIVSFFSGLILGALYYLGFFVDEKSADRTGNFLIIASFALMMLAAHTLDRLGEIKRSRN